MAGKKGGPRAAGGKTRGRVKARAKSRPAKAAPARAAQPVERRGQDRTTLRLRSATPGFTVNDIARSIAWYRDVLGCIVAEEWRDAGILRGATMRAGAVEFFLGQDDWKKGRDRVKGQGFRIYCTTAQDVDAIAARIKAAGGVLTHEPKDEPWGERDFGIIDPDGFKLTITTGA